MRQAMNIVAGFRYPANLLRTAALAVFLPLVLSACNTPTSAVEEAGSQPQQQAQQMQASENPAGDGDNAGSQDETQTAKIIHRKPTVTQKGTNIRAVVNGQPITNYDVQRRTAFLQLRRVGGNRSQKALEELVDEAIKMQEAKRRNTLASPREVDEAFARFASSNRMNASQLSQVLSQSGVTSGHFKNFIRGQMSWQRTVGARFRSDTTSKKSTQETMFEIRQSGGVKPETTEYLLEQTIFVTPASHAKDKAYIARRRKEADSFRQQFIRCDETVKQAAGMRDVTVRKLPRVLEPQLPPEWKDELAALSEGSVTTVKATEKGVEFLAICSKRTVNDDMAAEVVTQAKEFESLNDRGSEISESYLAELKSKAQIIYR